MTVPIARSPPIVQANPHGLAFVLLLTPCCLDQPAERLYAILLKKHSSDYSGWFRRI